MDTVTDQQVRDSIAEVMRLLACQKEARQAWRREHSTPVAVIECIDGRVLFENMVGYPLGTIRSFHAPGSVLDVNAPAFRRALYNRCGRATSLLLVTYHFSASDNRFGCAAHQCDLEQAKQAALGLIDQLAASELLQSGRIHPLLVGIETDQDSLCLHSQSGAVINMVDYFDLDFAVLLEMIKPICPFLPEAAKLDLTCLLYGNLEHINVIRHLQRTRSELTHRERVIAIGDDQTLDLLPKRNLAFKISACLTEPEILNAAKIAAGIIRSSIEKERIRARDGLMLFIALPANFASDEEQTRAFALRLWEKLVRLINNTFEGMEVTISDQVLLVDSAWRVTTVL